QVWLARRCSTVTAGRFSPRPSCMIRMASCLSLRSRMGALSPPLMWSWLWDIDEPANHLPGLSVSPGMSGEWRSHPGMRAAFAGIFPEKMVSPDSRKRSSLRGHEPVASGDLSAQADAQPQGYFSAGLPSGRMGRSLLPDFDAPGDKVERVIISR